MWFFAYFNILFNIFGLNLTMSSSNLNALRALFADTRIVGPNALDFYVLPRTDFHNVSRKYRILIGNFLRANIWLLKMNVLNFCPDLVGRMHLLLSANLKPFYGQMDVTLIRL